MSTILYNCTCVFGNLNKKVVVVVVAIVVVIVVTVVIVVAVVVVVVVVVVVIVVVVVVVAVVVEWTEAEISRFDVLVCKAMVASNSLHPCSAVERLYLAHCLGGKGLSNVDDLYRRCVIMLVCCLKTSDDALVIMCYLLHTSLPPLKSVGSRADAFVSAISLDIDLA